jgi:hypothetical protein
MTMYLFTTSLTTIILAAIFASVYAILKRLDEIDKKLK